MVSTEETVPEESKILGEGTEDGYYRNYSRASPNLFFCLTLVRPWTCDVERKRQSAVDEIHQESTSGHEFILGDSFSFRGEKVTTVLPPGTFDRSSFLLFEQIDHPELTILKFCHHSHLFPAIAKVYILHESVRRLVASSLR